jgi:hypothetical protein
MGGARAPSRAEEGYCAQSGDRRLDAHLRDLRRIRRRTPPDVKLA